MRRTRRPNRRNARPIGRILRYERLEGRDLMAVDATFSLGEPLVEGAVARFEVRLDFQATAGERLSYFGLDAENSSPELVGPGPDFSAFAFGKASPLLDGWTEIGSFNDPGFESTVEFDDSLVASLPSGNYLLGTLSVNFVAAGLSLGDVFTVAINGSDTVIGVTDALGAFSFVSPDFSPGSRVVVPGSISGPTSVLEGEAYSLMIQYEGDSGDLLTINWGDGSQTTLLVGELPPDNQVPHVYPDGDNNSTIAAQVQRGAGPATALGELDVAVVNVRPSLGLSGANRINEGEVFTLTLGAIDDPGEDVVTQYVVHWGDGASQTVDASSLPADRKLQHRYSDGPHQASLVVDLIDEDGPHFASGSLVVTVDNVAPSVELTGLAEIAEGAPYSLLISIPVDPGVDRVVRYVVEWGDGQTDAFDATAEPTNRLAQHIYADGPLVATIKVNLIDEDGTHVGTGQMDVNVVDSAPTVSLTGPTVIDEGAPYTLSLGQISDAGDDTVTHYVLDWGDGQVETISADTLPANRQVSHVYGDGPSLRSISVTLVDEDGSHPGAGSTGVNVNDVSPTVSFTGPTSVDEGAPYLLTIGTVTDPGNDTILRYIVDWGDGQSQTIEAAELPQNRQVPHAFRGEPYSPSITVTVVDEDGSHPSNESLDVSVRRAAPEVTVTGEDTAEAGIPYILTIGPLTGTSSFLVEEYVIDWGDGRQTKVSVEDLPEDGRFTHTYPAGPLDTVIRVQLVDGDGLPLAEFQQPILVTGEGVVIEQFETTAGIPGETGANVVVTATGQFVSAGPPELNSATIDWGDGSQPEAVPITSEGNTGRITARHPFPVGGVYVVTLTLTDPAGNAKTRETIAYITGIRRAGSVIQIVGSPGNDIITVTPQDTAHVFVNITTPVTGNIRRTYALADVQGIDVYVGGGHDRVMVSPRLSPNVYMDAGPGNDHLEGGNGPNILLGGPGDDQILGGDYRDVLVGGEGQNLLLGYAGDDVLVGGIWPHPVTERSDVLTVWNGGGESPDRASALGDMMDVLPDQTTDTLFGGDGQNVYFASIEDRIALDDQVQHSIPQSIDFGWASPNPDWPDIFTVVIGELPANDVKQTVPANSSDPEPESSSSSSVIPPSAPAFDPFDVNQDGYVSPIDAMIVISHLNGDHPQGESPSNQPLDVNGDGWVTPADALDIINRLNSPVGSAESEAAAVSQQWPLATSRRRVSSEWESLLDSLASDLAAQRPRGAEDLL